jgi:hypothetical protein
MSRGCGDLECSEVVVVVAVSLFVCWPASRAVSKGEGELECLWVIVMVIVSCWPQAEGGGTWGGRCRCQSQAGEVVLS